MMNMTLEQARELVTHAYVAMHGTNREALDIVYAHLAKAGEPVAWMVVREKDDSFPQVYISEAAANALIHCVTLPPFVTKQPLYADPPSAEPVRPVEAVDVKGILHRLDQDIAEAASAIQRPLEISKAKDEYWRAGLHAGITRARAEIALAVHQLPALAHPRPAGDAQSRNLPSDLRAFVMLLDKLADEWCAEEGETFRPAYELRSQVAAFVTLQPDSRRPRGVTEAAPTVEQAGEVVARMALGDNSALDAIPANEDQRLKATQYAVRDLRLSNLDVLPFVNGWLTGYAQPRAVGVPDGRVLLTRDHTCMECGSWMPKEHPEAHEHHFTCPHHPDYNSAPAAAKEGGA